MVSVLTAVVPRQFVHPTQPTMEGSHQLPTSKPLPVLPAVEAAKRLAAFAAVDRHVGLKHKVSRRGPGVASAAASALASTVGFSIPLVDLAIYSCNCVAVSH